MRSKVRPTHSPSPETFVMASCTYQQKHPKYGVCGFRKIALQNSQTILCSHPCISPLNPGGFQKVCWKECHQRSRSKRLGLWGSQLKPRPKFWTILVLWVQCRCNRQNASWTWGDVTDADLPVLPALSRLQQPKASKLPPLIPTFASKVALTVIKMICHSMISATSIQTLQLQHSMRPQCCPRGPNYFRYPPHCCHQVVFKRGVCFQPAVGAARGWQDSWKMR